MHQSSILLKMRGDRAKGEKVKTRTGQVFGLQLLIFQFRILIIALYFFADFES